MWRLIEKIENWVWIRFIVPAFTCWEKEDDD